MNITVLYEDADIVVINKPPGVVVNRAQSAPGLTIQDWMEDRYQLAENVKNGSIREDRGWWSLIPEDFDPSYGEPENVFLERTGMVHRLDKDTSGVLVLGKNPGAMLNLMSQFKQRAVSKKYLCLVHGLFAQDADEIRLPMARSSFNRQRFAVAAEGRPAITEFSVIGRYQFNTDLLLATVKAVGGEKTEKEVKSKLHLYQGFSLVECLPKTGRTHQIRVHMAYLQHPLVGDKLYVGKKRTKLDLLWCPRQFLHAASLQLCHPRTQEVITCTAELPEDLQEVLSYLVPTAVSA